MVFLTRQQFYDGLTFHRTVKNFVIQGGDPKGDGTGGPGYTTLDPPAKDATYPVGTVAMAKARSEPAGTAGSQFFVVTSSSRERRTGAAGAGPAVRDRRATSSAGWTSSQKIEAQPQAAGAQNGDGAPAQKIYIVKMTISRGLAAARHQSTDASDPEIPSTTRCRWLPSAFPTHTWSSLVPVSVPTERTTARCFPSGDQSAATTLSASASRVRPVPSGWIVHSWWLSCVCFPVFPFTRTNRMRV